MILLNSSGKTATPLMSGHDMFVSDDGGKVTLHVGNLNIHMDYELALQVSTMVRVRAKAVKKFMGDVSRHWSLIGMLEDAEEMTKEVQKRKWA